jgi:hypothetical protein
MKRKLERISCIIRMVGFKLKELVRRREKGGKELVKIKVVNYGGIRREM